MCIDSIEWSLLDLFVAIFVSVLFPILFSDGAVFVAFSVHYDGVMCSSLGQVHLAETLLDLVELDVLEGAGIGSGLDEAAHVLVCTSLCKSYRGLLVLVALGFS